MTRRWFVTACCALLVAPVTFAQPRGGAKPDPITGTWAGELVPQGGPPRPVTMELKFDGKKITGTVSGMPSPADVKGGTFDTKTGALKLELGKQGDPTVLLTLDGKVVKGIATGRVSGEGQGEFKLTKKP
jgi:hypothetical protein